MRFALSVAVALCVACAAAPTPRVQGCMARYQACVVASADMAAYVACRAQVDRDCLSSDGGAP